jgi:hypothetical protein
MAAHRPGLELAADWNLKATKQKETTMAMSGSGGGGGYGSRQHVEKSVRTGTGSRSARPAGVAQIGVTQGDHITNKSDTGYRGEKLHNDRTFQPVKFGNELATNVGKGGPGSGRTLYGQSGLQGQHGSVAGVPRPQGRGILNNE